MSWMSFFKRVVVAGLVSSFVVGAAFAEEPELDDKLPEGMYSFLANFIQQTYLSGYMAEKDLYEVYYAKKLKRYWSRRNVPLREVIADKKRHFKRWPYTSYRMIEDTLEILRIVGEENAYAVRFDYDYDAKRPGKVTSGRGRTALLLRVVEGRPVIYRETGRVLKRR